MRSIYKVALFATLGLSVACSSNTPVRQSIADDSTAESATAASESVVAQNKDRKICKERAITGSRFKQRTCMTAKEWETMSHESKGMVDGVTRNKIRYTD
ncbi:hypothetical protein [Microbulbifer taiwanensis]|uniref:Uncharacterized protein n=1 Tax=Microbulbifer taiwanensis TaxID=986746 RepID=A0ABW1YQZ0_9GAMM|nr:hypothetical protein [Microbulbifer taiwanensis]